MEYLVIDIQLYIDRLELLKEYIAELFEINDKNVKAMADFWMLYDNYGILTSPRTLITPTFEEYIKQKHEVNSTSRTEDFSRTN